MKQFVTKSNIVTSPTILAYQNRPKSIFPWKKLDGEGEVFKREGKGTVMYSVIFHLVW